MTNAIEQSKREMYSWLAQVKMIDQGGAYQINSATNLENSLESYLELLRQDHEALHETARKRFEDIQSLEAVNKKWQGIADNRGEHINHVTEQLANMTAERDHLRNRQQASDHAYKERDLGCSTSGQTSGDRASRATLDGNTAAILGAVVDVRQIVSDWAVYGYKAKKQMKKLAYALNNNPELHAAMLQFEKGDGYGTWFLNNTNCQHSFHPAFPSGEQCVFCGVGK